MEKLITIPAPVDAHVHVRYPGFTHKEDWRTASRAAVKGGIGTIFDMPNTKPATTTIELLKEKRLEAKNNSLVNFAFHFGATSLNTDILNNISNIPSVKLFMGSSTGDLLVADFNDEMKIFKSTDKIITVHAEDEVIISRNSIKYNRSFEPSVHSKIRSNQAALRAVENAIKLAEETNHKLVVAHVSTKNEIELIKKAKSRGVQVFCEATTHHLFLSSKDYKTFGNLIKVNPPVRSDSDQQALWDAISDGTIDFLGTDHAPHLLSEKSKPYLEAPAGIPGLETFLPLLLNAVNEKRLSIDRLIDLTSRNQERIYGFKNQAEVVVDLNRTEILLKKDLQTKCEWSPWENIKLTGWPVKTIINNHTMYDNGIFNLKYRGHEVKFNN